MILVFQLERVPDTLFPEFYVKLRLSTHTAAGKALVVDEIVVPEKGTIPAREGAAACRKLFASLIGTQAWAEMTEPLRLPPASS